MAKKKAAGSLKNGRDSQSKRLGIKVNGGNKIKNGTIILRQRGTKYNPGSNVHIGRDHTLHATCNGIVQYHTKNKKRMVSIKI